jgi:hypothetical protein
MHVPRQSSGTAVILVVALFGVLAAANETAPIQTSSKGSHLAAAPDVFHVVRKINDGLCTTSKGVGVQPGWMRCSGPYATEKAAKDWIANNGDDNGTCAKEKCDFKP